MTSFDARTQDALTEYRRLNILQTELDTAREDFVQRLELLRDDVVAHLGALFHNPRNSSVKVTVESRNLEDVTYRGVWLSQPKSWMDDQAIGHLVLNPFTLCIVHRLHGDIGGHGLLATRVDQIRFVPGPLSASPSVLNEKTLADIVTAARAIQGPQLLPP